MKFLIVFLTINLAAARRALNYLITGCGFSPERDIVNLFIYLKRECDSRVEMQRKQKTTTKRYHALVNYNHIRKLQQATAPNMCSKQT